MKADGYSSDELKSFHRILQAAIAEIGARRVDYPISGMIARLFEAADNGERDPAKLRTAVLAEAQSGTSHASRRERARATRSPIAITPKQRTNQPILTLYPRPRLSTQRS